VRMHTMSTRRAPMRTVLSLLATLVPATIVACSDGSPASPATGGMSELADDGGYDGSLASFGACSTPTSGTIPADVNQVIVDKCQPCHQRPPKNDAPFPLVTYEQIHGPVPTFPSLPIYEEMYVLIQPGADPHMPYMGAAQLTDAEFATLSSWLKACAPSGS
jgi:hypothetical protein